jgi:nucleoside-diphosphate-sugar epimerase
MSARRALMTGAGGFVGACLARRLLADGHSVEAIVRPSSNRWRLEELAGEIRMHEADVRDRDAIDAVVAAARPDWVFHLAAHGAYSWQGDPSGIFESTVLGTLNMLDASIRVGFDAFVHSGSSSEYGLKDHAPAEDELPEPNSDYAVAKLAATTLCNSRAVRELAHIVTLRLYSVYGPWEDRRRLLPTVVSHALRGELPPLVGPQTARDFVYVDDVCEAFVLAAGAAGRNASGIYNVGSGRQTTLREVVEAARTTFGVTAEPRWGTHRARSWDTDVWLADPRRIEHDLDWRAATGLEAGMRATASWLEGRPEPQPAYDGGAGDG